MLRLPSHRRSPIARPATVVSTSTASTPPQDRATDDQRVITTQDVVEETSWSSAKWSADTSTLVSRTTRTQRVDVRRERPRRDLTAATTISSLEAPAAARSAPYAKELIPASPSLRVLAEPFTTVRCGSGAPHAPGGRPRRRVPAARNRHRPSGAHERDDDARSTEFPTLEPIRDPSMHAQGASGVID